MSWMMALGLLLWLLPSAGSATTVVGYDLEDLAGASDTIVTGQVTEVASEWREGRIVTRVTIRPDTVLKGAPEDAVTVEVFGGVVDGIGQKVSGMASFEPDERVAVFLRRDATRPVYHVVGMAQGKLTVDLTPTGLEMIRDLRDLSFVQRRPDGVLEPAAPRLPERESLQAFFGRVNAILERQRRAPAP